MGHCSVRNSTYSDERWQYFVKADGAGALRANRFICLNYVESSAIAVSTLNAADEPILSGENMTGFSSLTAHDMDDKIPHRLFLLPIHPERLSFDYGCIYPDLDNTRVLESDCHFKVV
jgi:hypothetical protein